MRLKLRIKFLITIGILIILTISSVIAVSLNQKVNENSPNSSPTPTPTTPEVSPIITPSFTAITPSPTATPISLNQIKIVNKQIPPGYVMGFPVDGGLINGMNVIFIHDQNEKVDIRFTAKLSGGVKQLVIYAFAYEGQPTVRIGLQEDSTGRPKGQWIAGNGFGTMQLSSSNGFKAVQLGSPVSLAKGQVYHLVVEAVQEGWSGIAAITTYQANGFAQPNNPDDPDIVWSDPQLNILFRNDQSWQEQNKWPIFVVEYSDNQQEGQPYSLIAQWVVWGSTYVGQTIIPASDYRLSKFSFDVSQGSGTAQDKLYYQIRDSTNKILADGIFAESSQLTNSQTWIETTLSTPITLQKGELYRIVILSPQTNLSNAYYLYGHEFSFSPAIGYGSLQHQLTSSLDGGNTWGENSDADAVFKITNG